MMKPSRPTRRSPFSNRLPHEMQKDMDRSFCIHCGQSHPLLNIRHVEFYEPPLTEKLFYGWLVKHSNKLNSTVYPICDGCFQRLARAFPECVNTKKLTITFGMIHFPNVETYMFFQAFVLKIDSHHSVWESGVSAFKAIDFTDCLNFIRMYATEDWRIKRIGLTDYELKKVDWKFIAAAFMRIHSRPFIVEDVTIYYGLFVPSSIHNGYPTLYTSTIREERDIFARTHMIDYGWAKSQDIGEVVFPVSELDEPENFIDLLAYATDNIPGNSYVDVRSNIGLRSYNTRNRCFMYRGERSRNNGSSDW